MSMVDIEVGKRYEFVWPSSRPSMRMVGTVVSMRRGDFGRDLEVKWDESKKPHKLLVDSGVRVREVGAEEPGAFQIKVRK